MERMGESETQRKEKQTPRKVFDLPWPSLIICSATYFVLKKLLLTDSAISTYLASISDCGRNVACPLGAGVGWGRGVRAGGGG